MKPEDLELRGGGHMPEQYHAYHEGNVVAYIRLRFGSLTVEAPDAGGDLILEEFPNGEYKFDDDERDYWLGYCKQWICKYYESTLTT